MELGGGGGILSHSASLLGVTCSDEYVLPVGEVCVAEAQEGAWDAVLDWSDVGPPGNDVLKAPPWDDILPHHPFLVAVHAAHLPSGELILFHGQGETRVWPIGAPASEMRWHPVPFEVPQSDPDLCSYTPGTGQRCFADIFCSGHAVLPDGRFLVAGGNVTGGPTGGGLTDLFLFDAIGADEDLYPFGWAKSGDAMDIDRWYPTLTVIPGAAPGLSPFGRVLISSGATRMLEGRATPAFELYDPATDEVAPLIIQGDSPFTESDAAPIPLYPFMFLLPNGDIFYAGGEGTAQTDGRVLIPDYNNGGTWAWHPREFQSAISGGSAVMYAPGKIMKSGGVVAGDDDGRVLGAARLLHAVPPDGQGRGLHGTVREGRAGALRRLRVPGGAELDGGGDLVRHRARRRSVSSREHT